ncbi:MAG: hypothetical protein Q9225_000968 [Loekoesia sp. 1 TL-2023]
MHYLKLLALFLKFVPILTANVPTPTTNLVNASAPRLDVPQATEIKGLVVYAGQGVFAKGAVMLFHLAQLDMYRLTVRARGDKAIEESIWEARYKDMYLQIIPQPSKIMTFGESLYGLQAMLHSMLLPKDRDEGFREQDWLFSWKKPNSPERLKLADLDAPSSDPEHLSAPFPVPDTDVTLLVGRRGIDLAPATVIWPLNYLINEAWQAIALNHYVQPIGQLQATDDSHRVLVQMRPRMSGTTPLVTDSNLVEATTGIVYYMLQEGWFGTTVTVVRPNQSGRRIPVCEIQIGRIAPRDLVAGPGNDTLIETS